MKIKVIGCISILQYNFFLWLNTQYYLEKGPISGQWVLLAVLSPLKPHHNDGKNSRRIHNTVTRMCKLNVPRRWLSLRGQKRSIRERIIIECGCKSTWRWQSSQMMCLFEECVSGEGLRRLQRRLTVKCESMWQQSQAKRHDETSTAE